MEAMFSKRLEPVFPECGFTAPKATCLQPFAGKALLHSQHRPTVSETLYIIHYFAGGVKSSTAKLIHPGFSCEGAPAIGIATNSLGNEAAMSSTC